MKNTPLILGVIIVLLAAAGGYFFMQGRITTSSEGTNSKKMAAEGVSSLMSLKDLMNLGSSQMCTFSYSDEVGSVQGTSYVANGKVRTDFSGSNPEQGEYTGGMLLDSEYMYTWNSQMEQGIKMAIPQEEGSPAGGTEDYSDEQYQLDPNEKVEYNCTNWNTDNSKFTPPSDITFTDFSEQMEQLQQMMPVSEDAPQTMELDADTKAAQCAACDQAGDAAEACRQALGC